MIVVVIPRSSLTTLFDLAEDEIKFAILSLAWMKEEVVSWLNSNMEQKWDFVPRFRDHVMHFESEFDATLFKLKYC